MMMSRIFLAIAAILAGVSVAGGAFASHALRERISDWHGSASALSGDRALEIFETGAKYQMYHALALLLVALFLSRAELSQTYLLTAGYAFIAGIVIFSGSLYALSLSGVRWLGAITPFGGVAFLIGWGCLAIAAFIK